MTASDSRFKLTPMVNIDGRIAYGKWVPPAFIANQSTTSTNYIVPSSREGRPDLISNDMYNTPNYYWVIVAFNSPLDPLNWPKTGMTIRIPNLNSVIEAL